MSSTLRPRQNGRHFADDPVNAFPWLKLLERWLTTGGCPRKMFTFDAVIMMHSKETPDTYKQLISWSCLHCFRLSTIVMLPSPCYVNNKNNKRYLIRATCQCYVTVWIASQLTYACFYTNISVTHMTSRHGTALPITGLLWENERWPVDSPHRDWQCRIMFPLLLAWKNWWTNNQDSDDLRNHHANVMSP